MQRLKVKDFASTNVVLGIESYTYQYNTLDTFGFAMKATYGEVDGVGRDFYKDPITDDGMKKSAKGLLAVHLNEGEYVLEQQVSWEQEGGDMRTVYKDGKLIIDDSLESIRQRIKSEEMLVTVSE